MVLGFVLLVMEIIAPGIFMLWIGIAALIVGAVSLLHLGRRLLDLGSPGPRVPGAVAGLGLRRQEADGRAQ